MLAEEVERLRLLTFRGCGDQFSAHDPGTCGACVAGMTCKPAPVLLTDDEVEQCREENRLAFIARPNPDYENDDHTLWLCRAIEAAVLKKNGLA